MIQRQASRREKEIRVRNQILETDLQKLKDDQLRDEMKRLKSTDIQSRAPRKPSGLKGMDIGSEGQLLGIQAIIESCYEHPIWKHFLADSSEKSSAERIENPVQIEKVIEDWEAFLRKIRK